MTISDYKSKEIVDTIFQEEIEYQLLKNAVQVGMFCQICNKILDSKKNAVLCENPRINPAFSLNCVSCFDNFIESLDQEELKVFLEDFKIYHSDKSFNPTTLTLKEEIFVDPNQLMLF